MLNTPHLLEQLVSLTGIRDLELLEVSLLKTLHGIIRPTGLSLYKVSGKGDVRSQVVFGADRCIVLRDGFDVPPELQHVFEECRESDHSETQISLNGEILRVMTVMNSRASSTLLVISARQALQRANTRMIDGMLQIYRNFCQLLQESQTDALTGLANRKTFDECFGRIHELQPYDNADGAVPVDQRTPTEQRSYWLAMIDIDHFKSVNDRFGHLYGDEVLILMAHLLRSTLRNDDWVFRFGGEEFVLMVRCQSRQEASTLLERLRRSVELQEIPQVGKITISIGATEMLRDTFSGTLLDYADKAMYFSKQNGRNRLTFFEDMVTQGLAQHEVAPEENLDFF